MRRCLIALSIVLSLAAPATADVGVFPRMLETIWLNGDGSARLDVEVECPAGTMSPLRLPLSAPTLANIVVSGVPRGTASTVGNVERRDVVISFPGPLAAPATLRVTGTVARLFAAITAPPRAFGNRTMTHRLLNSTPAVFANVTSQVVLPSGFVVTSVEDSDPPSAESSTTPPFSIVALDGRHAVRVSASNVGLGQATSVTFRFKERRVPPLIPVALFVLSAAYLFGFRNLTKQSDGVR